MYPILAVPGPRDRSDQGVVIPWLWEVRAHSAGAWKQPFGHIAGAGGTCSWSQSWRRNPEQASVWAAAAGPGVAAFVGAGWGWGSHCSRND